MKLSSPPGLILISDVVKSKVWLTFKLESLIVNWPSIIISPCNQIWSPSRTRT